MEKIFEYWVFRMRPWARWIIKTLGFIICVAILGAIAGGVVVAWVNIFMGDF